jgi:prolyl-tRNA editing enzyme YbaK/EbsC (Cys-tRNA(Pro) deacylase)
MDNNQYIPLSFTANKFQDILHTLGFNFQVFEFKESTRTSADAAMRVGCKLGQIVKSLIFRCQDSGKPLLVLTSGANRVDECIVGSYAGENIERADSTFVREVTGYAIGGVPPIGHPHPLDTYLDEDLLQYDEIWAAAGTPNAVFKLTPADLLKITAGKKVKVKS